MIKDHQKVSSAYNKKAVGPCKDEIARAFFEKKTNVILHSVFKRAASDGKKLEKITKEAAAEKLKAAGEIKKWEARAEEHRVLVQAKAEKIEKMQGKLEQTQQTMHAAEMKAQQTLHKKTKEMDEKLQTSNIALSKLKQVLCPHCSFKDCEGEID